MALLRLLASLLKAVPVLGRLFLRFADDKREQKAQERYEDKLTLIDNAVDKYHRAGQYNNSKELMAHPEFPRAAFHAPEFTRQALKTIAELEYHLERRKQ